MSYYVVLKAANMLPSDLANQGLIGIPAQWPVVVQPYTGVVPAGFTLLDEQQIANLKSANLSAYEAWYSSKVQTSPQPPNTFAISSMPDPAPFATPSYRTKKNATASLATVEPGTIGDIDFAMTEERYVSGGALIVENAEIGDYVIGYLEDKNGLIPAPYRAVLCEAWPIVAKYIEKTWIAPVIPGSIQAGSICHHEVNTYPLNAKITAGLFLCIEYHAANSGLPRRIGVNYDLTKKL